MTRHRSFWTGKWIDDEPAGKRAARHQDAQDHGGQDWLSKLFGAAREEGIKKQGGRGKQTRSQRNNRREY